MTNQEQEERMHCKKCHAVLRDGARFCSVCGERIERKTACKSCGKEHQGKFCPNCGTPAGSEPEVAATVAQSAPEVAAVENKEAKKEETRNHVEHLVQVSKTYYKLKFFIFLSLTVSYLFLTFIPLCSVIGLVDINILDVIFDVVKDTFKGFTEGFEGDASTWKWSLEFTAVVVYFIAGIYALIGTCTMAIKLLTMSSLEITIRETKGKLEVPLTAKELRDIKGKSRGSGQLSAITIGLMYMLFLPIWFFVENREILLINYMTMFYLASFFTVSLALSIVACVFAHKNKKEIELFLSIKKSYKRFKIYKFKQELED